MTQTGEMAFFDADLSPGGLAAAVRTVRSVNEVTLVTHSMIGTSKGQDRQPGVWLGTVQLGMSYGLSAGNPDTDEVCRILDMAWECGIRKLDTARAYGESEARIGAWMKRSGRHPTIATKVPSLAAVAEDRVVPSVAAFVSESLATLGIDRIDYLMLHRAEDLVRPGVAAALSGMVADGRVGAAGVSCYEAGAVFDALSAFPELGIVQAPANVADMHIADGGLHARLPGDCVLMLRSLYLQGALLMDTDRLPEHLAPLAPICAVLAAASRELGVSRQGLAIGCVLAEMPDAEVVIGVDSVDQVRALADVAGTLGTVPPTDVTEALATMRRTLPPGVADPRIWPKG